MGRGVDYLNNASRVAYVDVSDMDEDYGWEWFTENITETLTKKYPSLSKCDKWEGREVHIILENKLVNVAVSEYCGVATISVAPKDDFYYSEPYDGLAGRMAYYVGKYVEDTFGECRKVATASNGESFYERKV